VKPGAPARDPTDANALAQAHSSGMGSSPAPGPDITRPASTVLAEVYYRGRSMVETARILRIPPGTVRSRTFYRLRAVRRALAVHRAVA